MIKAGCTSGERAWVCKSEALTALGCDYAVSDILLAGLAPAYPVLRCRKEGWESPGARFREVGCMMHAYETLVLLRDGEFQLTGLIPELQAVFAPVESANEALSYALAATGLYARYGIETHECTSVDCYLADTIEDTHVDETEGRYVVHLFSDYEPPCGCGTHITCAVRVSVTREGQISQARTRLHRFEACLD